VNIPATNTARFNHLISLARQLEENRAQYYGHARYKALQLAAIYREMTLAAMPTAPNPEALELTGMELNALAAKLRRMTVANGCTHAEADTALQMLLRLEGGR
jgi:hypothetical protein